MKVINQLLAEMKVYQKEKNIKRYFSIRNFNFNNNPDISYLTWKGFFDNLFSVYNIDEEDDELEIIEDLAIEVPEEPLTKEEKLMQE
jgi:hypothetical protein